MTLFAGNDIDTSCATATLSLSSIMFNTLYLLFQLHSVALDMP